jgi:hypothetical protein
MKLQQIPSPEAIEIITILGKMRDKSRLTPIRHAIEKINGRPTKTWKSTEMRQEHADQGSP